LYVRFAVMKIVVATPLYPPEIGDPAPYVKELAKRLQGRHEVTVVAYGRLPEQVPGVRIISVDKRRPLPARLLAYTRALARAAKSADLIYAMNGASVELPTLILSLISRTPIIFGIADGIAHKRAEQRLAVHVLERIALAHARAVVRTFPMPRPEILPLAPRPEEALRAYEKSWQTHLDMLDSLFHHAH
jgi:glycosyltransferase involved in cell wall biosynthesis